MSKKRGGGYEVGYGKPPKDKMFKKGGPSPNPHGRPPKIESIHASVLRSLSQEIKVTTADGEVRDMQKRDVVGERLVQKAANGDIQAIKLIFQIDEARIHGEAEQDNLMSEEEVAKREKMKKILINSIDSMGRLKADGMYNIIDDYNLELTPMGELVIGMLRDLQYSKIRTVEQYKQHLTLALEAFNRYAFERLSYWVKGLMMEDLL